MYIETLLRIFPSAISRFSNVKCPPLTGCSKKFLKMYMSWAALCARFHLQSNEVILLQCTGNEWATNSPLEIGKYHNPVHCTIKKCTYFFQFTVFFERIEKGMTSNCALVIT
jgi:hypothetical protein